MQYKLSGFERVSYVSKKTNNQVNGWKLFITSVGSSNDFVNAKGGDTFGSCTYSESGSIPFINDEIAKDSHLSLNSIGKNVEIVYNHLGRIQRLIIC